MKRFVAALLLVASSLGAWTYVNWRAEAADPKPGDAQPVADIATFMQLKLSHSQSVLEGIALEDYEKIARHAQSMALLGEDEKWMVFQTPEYRQHSAEFQQVCKQLQRAGEKKNVDAAALAYVQLTMSCVNCHKYTRGIRMANVPLDGSPALGGE